MLKFVHAVALLCSLHSLSHHAHPVETELVFRALFGDSLRRSIVR